MRWLNRFVHRLNEESGATAVIVAISLTALIGMAAFAIDVGALYGERRQLQSGADAGALAIAEDCALGEPCTTATANATAGTYASSNANDAAAGIESVELNTGAQEVTVKTETRDASGSDVYKPFLAQVIGFNGTTVNAQATAIWGYPSGLNVLPLIISDCEWNLKTSPIYFHHPEPPYECDAGPAGTDLPGGFGWLDTIYGCEVDLEVGDWVDADTGNSPSNGCKTQSWWESLIGEIILIPFYDAVIDNGKEYHVSGFGAFRLTGYSFPVLGKQGADCGPPSQRCITGEFTTASVPDGELGGPNRGVVVVKLTK